LNEIIIGGSADQMITFNFLIQFVLFCDICYSVENRKKANENCLGNLFLSLLYCNHCLILVYLVLEMYQ